MDVPRRRRTADAQRRGVRIRPDPGRGARVGLLPVRRADPRRRDHRLGRPGLHRRATARRLRLRDRLRRRPLRDPDLRQALHRPPQGPPAADPGGDRGRDGRGRVADDLQSRRSLRKPDRRRPPGVSNEPHDRPRNVGCGRRPSREPQRRRATRGGGGGWWAGGRRGIEAAGTGSRSRHHRPGRVLQHRRQAGVDLRPDRRGEDGARRLLDLHLHQLHPHPSRGGVLVPALREGGTRRDRRTHPRVPLRAGRRQRRRRGSSATASPIPSSRTTTTAPGTPSTTSTGRPST